jgi:hypothetical protein
MKEILRVLKHSGITILLLVTIGAKLKETYQDASKLTAGERAQEFGQYNHVRIYAESDYLNRLRRRQDGMSDANRCGRRTGHD